MKQQQITSSPFQSVSSKVAPLHPDPFLNYHISKLQEETELIEGFKRQIGMLVKEFWFKVRTEVENEVHALIEIERRRILNR